MSRPSRSTDPMPREHHPWPSSDLETISACPICGDAGRSVLFEGLTDRVFAVAGGEWNLYKCAKCGSAYLDPRPTPSSIGRAYGSYFTHVAEDHPIVRRKGILRSALHDLVNGYQNVRYGTKKPSAAPLGRWLLPLLPPLRAAADAECRHMPKAPDSGGRLLDVGCGNGGFLLLARQAGWQVEGLDFDAAAVRTAQSRGLDVHHGNVELLVDRDGFYDFITLSHVIEHVHQPLKMLQHLHGLLRPGGVLWLETPNIASLGAEQFANNWRALEPPRHLALFNSSSLRESLHLAGFRSLKQHWHGMSIFGVFSQSDALARNEACLGASYRGRPPFNALLAEFREWARPDRREFLTFTARKPNK